MNDDIFGEVISSYTRDEAIADGVLVDVSSDAKEAGFRFPVAVTRAVWDGFIVPDDNGKNLGQSPEGRLWDVLMVLHFEIAKLKASPSTVQLDFSVLFVLQGKTREIRLKAICGPGDDAEPVLTVMLPEED